MSYQGSVALKHVFEYLYHWDIKDFVERRGASVSNIPVGITREDVVAALRSLDRGEPHGFGPSTGYDLVEAGKRYPPKAVLGLAARRVLGRPLGPYDFKGGEDSQSFRLLRDLGFVIEGKRAEPSSGSDWSEDEVRTLVEDYFKMLVLESERKPYSKTEHRRALGRVLKGRSAGSIEFKHQNVSAVLFALGFPFIDGYKPAKNYQQLLESIVLEHLGSTPEDVKAIGKAVEEVPAPPPTTGFEDCVVPAPDWAARERVPPTSTRRPRKYDYAAKDEANRKLGHFGERFVVDLERWRLDRAGRPDLARRVEHVSDTQGDGLGYDVLSFDAVDGEPVYIEVKTTNCGPLFPFRLSANELHASAQIGKRFRLARVFDASRWTRLFEIQGDISQAFTLTPVLFEARRA